MFAWKINLIVASMLYFFFRQVQIASLKRGNFDVQVWALTETLKSDWALEMAKSVTVEMIKSTETAAGNGIHRQPPSSSSPTGKIISVDTGSDETLGVTDDPPASSGSGAPDNRLGEVVDQLGDVDGGGEVRIIDVKASEGLREREDDMASAGAEDRTGNIP